MLDLAVAIPTLMGSIVSMLAAGSVFVCYLVLPRQTHFRHTLILNLAAADFINALNNTISGIYAFTHNSIPLGVICSINGWVAQITVQATDFAVLFISVATVITLRQFNYKPKSKNSTKLLLTLGIWFIPSTTSLIGLGLHAYQPVSGNWCWLSADDPVLRYVLGHGWRLIVIFTIICLYTYLSIYMHRHFAALREIEDLNAGSASDASIQSDTTINRPSSTYEYNEFEVFHEFEDGYLRTDIPIKEASSSYPPMSGSKNTPSTQQSSASDPNEISLPPSPSTLMKQMIHLDHPELANPLPPSSFQPIDGKPSLMTRDPLALIRRPPPSNLTNGTPKESTQRITVKAREFQIQKLLLLNAYPIAYIVLWIPGILNRFAELSDHRSRALRIAQSSTQWVGLANALVYGYNERIWSLALLWWRGKGEKMEAFEVANLPAEPAVADGHPEGWI